MKKLLNAFVPTLGALVVLAGSATTAGQQPPPTVRTGEPAAPRPAAPSLARPASPTKAPDAAGFLQRWLVLEPIKVPGQLTQSVVQALVAKEYFPNQFTVVPHDGDKVNVADESLTWHALDTAGYNLNLFHFAYALNKPTSNVLFWAVTVVDAPRDMTNVRLAIGSNAASIWWLNGQEVIGLYNDRQAVIDDGVSKRVTLKKGPNVIRAAIVNAGGATDFCARFIDGNDAPIRTIVVNLKANGPER
ncbi:MAG: acetylxylan esterase [Acidobacteriota bacterium]